MVVCILSKRLENKLEVIEGDQFAFQKSKGARDVIRLMRIVSERVLDIEKEAICLSFID
jgi:hypothetical protein